MTLLNWWMLPDELAIMSDTLAISGETHRPSHFTTKVFPALHLNAVIAGTGFHKLITDFYVEVATRMVVRDVVQLSQFATDILRDIWADIPHPFSLTGSATVYTFGLDPDAQQFTGFAYRSSNGFQPEQMRPGQALKPPPTGMTSFSLASIDDFVGMAFRQQAEDRARPRLDRVGIGGDLLLHHLTKDGRGDAVLNIARLAALDHRDSDLEMALAHLPTNSGSAWADAIIATDP